MPARVLCRVSAIQNPKSFVTVPNCRVTALPVWSVSSCVPSLLKKAQL